MTGTTGEAPPTPDPLLTAALRDELIDVRQRGIDGIDTVTSREQRLVLPLLETLARAYAHADPAQPRIPLIRQLLRAGLDAWQKTGMADEAALVRKLFFANGSPRPATAEELLKQARGKQTTNAFYHRQRDLFERFAEFLIKWVPVPGGLRLPKPSAGAAPSAATTPQRSATPEPTTQVAEPEAATSPEPAPAEPARRRGWPTWAWAITVVLACAALAYAAVLLVHLLRPTHAPAATDAQFTFDALGGGDQIIRTFSRPTVNSEVTGRYPSGETEPVRCKTTGELVTPNAAANEHGVASNVWLQIDITGPPQFARWTYGRIDPTALAALPQCSGAS